MNFKNVVSLILKDSQADAATLVRRIKGAIDVHVEPLSHRSWWAPAAAALGVLIGFVIGRLV